MLGNSAVVVVRTRPRAIPLAKITMRKSTHGFPLSFPCMMSMGLRLAALRTAGAPLLLDYNSLLPDHNNLLPDYNNPIIIYYYYNPRININPSCPACSKLTRICTA